MNKVGPYNNPQETYNYYYLPFCAPNSDQKPMHKWGGLGEVLGGNELIDSQLDIKFRSTGSHAFLVDAILSVMPCQTQEHKAKVGPVITTANKRLLTDQTRLAGRVWSN